MKTCGGVVLSAFVGFVLLFGSCVAFVSYVGRDAQQRKAAEDAKLTPEQREARDTEAKLVSENRSKGITATRKTKEMVLAKLKAPSTAKFNLNASDTSDHKTIVVSGSVDSQNSFGAMLRNRVFAKWNAETMQCVDLVIE